MSIAFAELGKTISVKWWKQKVTSSEWVSLQDSLNFCFDILGENR